MIPYIDVPPWVLFDLGGNPVSIHLFGVLVATGVVVGASLAGRYAERNAIDIDYLRWFGFRLVVGGFIICHIIDVVFYQPDKLADDPLLLLKVWEGISSYGGFIGGLIMFLWYTRARYKPPVSRMELADNAIVGFAPGFWFGRMGCTVAHDHQGVPTDFALAVNFKPGKYSGAQTYDLPYNEYITAHDLGLYEAAFLMPVIVFGVFALIKLAKNRRPGLLLAYSCLVYSIPRFFLEFLRIERTDPRYFGLTAAQYFSIGLFAAGLYVVFKIMPTQTKTTAELVAEREAAAKEAAAARKAAAEREAKSKAKAKASLKKGKKKR